VKVDSKTIDAMVAWPRPSNIFELHGFLGWQVITASLFGIIV
jgi:hypothetical protein